MKRFFAIAAFVCVAASVMASPVQVQTYSEPFTYAAGAPSAQINLGATTSGEVLVEKLDGTNVYWAGFPGNNSGNVALANGTQLRLQNAARARAYTRFDTTSSVAAGPHNVSAFYLDMSQAGATITLNVATNQRDFSCLIHTSPNDKWYESNKVVGIVLGDNTINVASLTWREVVTSGDPAAVPGADMNEVDIAPFNNTNGALTYVNALGEATPPLSMVTGFGLACDSTTATGNFNINIITLNGAPVASGIADWTQF